MMIKSGQYKFRHISYTLGFFIIFTSCTLQPVSISFENEYDEPQIIYGINSLKQSLIEKDLKAKSTQAVWSISIRKNLDLSPEAFDIHADGTNITLQGGDATGVMYGLLHIKEQFEFGHLAIEDISESPALSFRAIKFNLPWDSYRNGPALQLHTETCRDTVFWQSFLDMMAENRFNKLTLWNLHPFNYLVKTEKYPEACGFNNQEMAEWESFWTHFVQNGKK